MRSYLCLLRNSLAPQDEVPWANHTGLDIFNTSSLRPGAINTLQLHTLVLSGPIDLVGGGGLSGIARLPIYVPNVSETETFGNSVSGVWASVGCELAWQGSSRLLPASQRDDAVVHHIVNFNLRQPGVRCVGKCGVVRHSCGEPSLLSGTLYCHLPTPITAIPCHPFTELLTPNAPPGNLHCRPPNLHLPLPVLLYCQSPPMCPWACSTPKTHVPSSGAL